MPMMTAGQLDTFITLQAKSVARDAVGEAVPEWYDVATVWAKVKDLSGRELIAARAVQSESARRITLRWRTGVTSDMRIIHQGRALAITAPPRMIGRRQWLELDCSEGLIDG